MPAPAKSSQPAPNSPIADSTQQQSDFFAARISAMIDLRHPLAPEFDTKPPLSQIFEAGIQ